MSQVAIRSVPELDPFAKEWVQKLVGRELCDDEQVSVRVFSIRPAPPAENRQGAGTRLETLLDKMADQMKNVPAQEFDEAVAEAMKAVRPTFEPMP